MRTVNLIQFTEDHTPDYGWTPDTNVVYNVIDMNDEYEYEYTNDDGDDDVGTMDSISIRVSGRKRHITGTDNVDYNLLTIVLEDDSNLFQIGGR